MTTVSLRHARLTRACQESFKISTQQQQRYFHPSRRKLQDASSFPNHYETLNLTPSATPAEIKKQFYALSKKYHPDLNHEPSASQRFVQISEAYHVLGSSEKKGIYDRDFHRAHASHTHVRHGSHHSSSTRSPAGGRPASGLSKRRSQFRGPPPSFYAQGGYGSQGGKRQRAQADADARHEQQSAGYPDHPGGLGSQPNFRGTGGFSPGDHAGYYPDPDLPYFNKEGHRRTHEGLGARRERMDSSSSGGPHVEPHAQQGSLLANFLIVSAVVATATVVATAVSDFVKSAGTGAPKLKKRGDG